jgi:anti-anti-sigma factor
MLKVEKKDNNYFFTPNGELSLQKESIIKKEIIDTLQKDPEYDGVYIIMEYISFIDSSGIGMLIYINKFLNSQGKILHLISPPPAVFKILKLGAFDKLFKIEK